MGSFALPNAYLKKGLLVLASAATLSCSSPEPRPRPRGFPRIVLPEHAYRDFTCRRCPFTFSIPAYGSIVWDRPRADETWGPNDSCRFDVRFDDLGAQFHFTLERLTPDYPYFEAFEKYRSLIYRHAGKGKIYESDTLTEAGRLRRYAINGQVPTTAQVFLSDSSRYALVGALYFERAIENDSLRPVMDHLAYDLYHSIKSVEWLTPTAQRELPGCE